MRKGTVSRTAQFVAYNRALGSLSPVVPEFSDPVAEGFLPERWKKQVETRRARVARAPSHSPYPFWFRGMGTFNQFRTVVLDRALRAARPFDQCVILGAGLDSRAWRMPELAPTVVFEVDHPDTQGFKQEKAAGLAPLAKEIRFVPMDFTKDNLASKLAASGYRRDLKTFWLWEGVTMYLTPVQVRENLASIGELSSAGSHLALTYMAKKNGKIPTSRFLALLGEPPRSAFFLDELESMAKDIGWSTVSNTGITDWQPELAPNTGLTERKVGMQWNERVWVGSAAG
jgi:methyltransferase (TIGR00027 family)